MDTSLWSQPLSQLKIYLYPSRSSTAFVNTFHAWFYLASHEQLLF